MAGLARASQLAPANLFTCGSHILGCQGYCCGLTCVEVERAPEMGVRHSAQTEEAGLEDRLAVYSA